MLKLRHRDHTATTWQSWDVNLGSLVSESVLLLLHFDLASTHGYCLKCSLLLSTSNEQLFALILLILCLYFFWYRLLASAFYLYPWNLSLQGHHWFCSQYNGIFQFLFLLDLFLAFDADTHLYGILILTSGCWLALFLPHWASMFLFTLFPSPSLCLSLEFSVLSKKLFNVNFMFKSR